MGKRRGAAINIDTKGGWTPDAGGRHGEEAKKKGKAYIYRKYIIKPKKSGSFS